MYYVFARVPVCFVSSTILNLFRRSKMPPLSAFAAYKKLKKPPPKKKPNPLKVKKMQMKSKAKAKGEEKPQLNGHNKNKKMKNKKTVVMEEDKSRAEEQKIRTYEQFIKMGLAQSQNDSTASNDGSYNGAEVDAEVDMEVTVPKKQKKKLKSTDNNNKAKKKIGKPNGNNPNSNKISKSSRSTSLGVMESADLTESTYKKYVSNLSNANVVQTNSIKEGENAFQWIISPIALQDFFSSYWEANTLLIKRKKPKFYSSLISFKAIDQMLLNHHVEFTKNIDITSYENGVRETHNPEGRALPPAVWDFYRDGCSVRLLNPQTFIKPLYDLCATLQEYFHCLVGANAYLTPPNSQGFAPHYDDIEAFVLQIEGRKRWKVYAPRSAKEMLPRYSSKNFTESEIGQPVLDQVLEPGDLLYFPRGAIHQACTEPGYHSLHITLSVYQKQSYADLLEKMLPAILKSAIDSNVNIRRGLPLNIWHNAGIVYNEVESEERELLKRRVTKIIGECLQSVQLSEVIDAAVDELAKKFQHEALPPSIQPAEKSHTIFGLRNEANVCGDCPSNCSMELRTNVRLLRANILRLVAEEEQIRIYYYLDNSKEYCEYEPNFFEIEPILAASVEVLIKSYPEYIGVSQFPLDDDESKLDLATSLWKRGLLMTEKPIRN